MFRDARSSNLDMDDAKRRKLARDYLALARKRGNLPEDEALALAVRETRAKRKA